VLVGRPNVGKSTLFNRVTRMRRAIVTSIPGTTRDVLAQPVEWEGTRFELTDTGGMFGASEDPLHALVLERGRRAIGDADLLVLVVDGREGLVGGDREIAQVIREAGKPALLAINKLDDKRARSGALEMYQLGFDPVSRSQPNMVTAWATCSTRSCASCLHRDHRRHRSPLRSRWRSSGVQMQASPRWSIGCFVRSGCS